MLRFSKSKRSCVLILEDPKLWVQALDGHMQAIS